ncbi:MAG: hypothetical protein VYE68_13625 [Acidobacteriota bacterium]|nr:hypothetical protein [Acidobacteriota bacterium]
MPICSIVASKTTRHCAAEQGDADAQFNLGWMYRNGRGVDLLRLCLYLHTHHERRQHISDGNDPDGVRHRPPQL